MAIKAKLLSVPLNIVTGSQAITGMGFQPEVIIGMITDLTGAAAAANHHFCFFCAKPGTPTVSTPTGAFMNMSGEDGVTSDYGAGCFYMTASNVSLFRIIDQDAVTKVAATLTSIDADGLTINVTTAPAAAYQLWLLGLQDDTGSAIQAVMSSFNANTTPGLQDITGLGFSNPDCVIFFNAFNQVTGPPGSGGSNLSPLATLGFADGSSQCCANITEVHGANPGTTKRSFRTDRCSHQEGSSTTYLSLSYVKGLPDGFQVNVMTTAGSAYAMKYIALKGIAAKVLNVISSTATGQTAVTGSTFTPSAILAIQSGVQVETTQDNSRWSIGMGTGPTARMNVAFASLDNILNSSNVSEKLSNVSLLTDLNANHGAPTDANRWDIAAVSSNGFTYDHEVADGGAIKMGFLLLGAAAAGNQTLSLTGIASAGAFGTVSLFTGSQAQTIQLVGIASAAAFGTPVLGGAKIIQPVGIKGPDTKDVELTGTFDDVAFDPQFTQYKVELTVGPDPRSQFVALGTGTAVFLQVAPGQYTGRWSLSNAAGTTLANTQTTIIVVTNFGTPALVIGGGGGASVIQPPSITSSESFGNVSITQVVQPTGIASAAAFGTPTMATGGLAIILVGIPSPAAFGNVTIQSDQNILVVGIASSEDFGFVQLVFEGSQILNIVGIDTAEQFGTVTMSVPTPAPEWPVIPDPDTVWTRIPPGREG